MNQQTNQSSGREPDNDDQSAENAAMRELASADLLQGNREIAIRHGDEIYRLRVTRKGKLILHK